MPRPALDPPAGSAYKLTDHEVEAQTFPQSGVAARHAGPYRRKKVRGPGVKPFEWRRGTVSRASGVET